MFLFFFFFQAEDGIRDGHVTGVQTCALPILSNDVNAPTIDYTATRTYAGASRDVNLYEAGGPVNENYSLTANQYWDRASGVRSEERRVGKECRCRGSR